MKSIKKLLSVLTAISIIAVMFAVAVVPVYADPGDVFTVNAVPEGWRYYTSSYITRENSGAQFGVDANKGKGLDNYGVLLANALSTEVVKPATTYRISFNIYTWYNISALQADVDTGTALWSRTNKITTFSNLANNVTASSGGGDTRYSYDVSLDVSLDAVKAPTTAPATPRVSPPTAALPSILPVLTLVVVTCPLVKS